MEREDRKTHLLDCARRVFAKRGYHEASIDDVIQEAGVARGTFYNYFDSKREIFQEVLEDLFRMIWAAVPPIRTGPGEDIRAQVAMNISNLLTVFATQKELGRILLGGAVGLDPEAERALAGFYKLCRERLAKALAKGQDLGIVRQGDAGALALCVLGILKEYWSQLLLGASPPELEKFLAEVQHLLLKQPGAKRKKNSG